MGVTGVQTCALPISLVALAGQRGFQLGFEQLLDEGADACAHSRLEWIKPVLAENKLALGRPCGLPCGMAGHGVISTGAPTPVWACWTSRRLRRPQIPTTSATARPAPPWLSNECQQVLKASSFR